MYMEVPSKDEWPVHVGGQGVGEHIAARHVPKIFLVNGSHDRETTALPSVLGDLPHLAAAGPERFLPASPLRSHPLDGPHPHSPRTPTSAPDSPLGDSYSQGTAPHRLHSHTLTQPTGEPSCSGGGGGGEGAAWPQGGPLHSPGDADTAPAGAALQDGGPAWVRGRAVHDGVHSHEHGAASDALRGSPHGDAVSQESAHSWVQGNGATPPAPDAATPVREGSSGSRRQRRPRLPPGAKLRETSSDDAARFRHLTIEPAGGGPAAVLSPDESPASSPPPQGEGKRMRASDMVLAVCDALNRTHAPGSPPPLSHPPGAFVTALLAPRGGEVEIDQAQLWRLGVRCSSPTLQIPPILVPRLALHTVCGLSGCQMSVCMRI